MDEAPDRSALSAVIMRAIPARLRATIGRALAQGRDPDSIEREEREERERQRDAQRRAIRRTAIASSGLVGEMLTDTFDTFCPRSVSQERAVELARRAAAEYPAGRGLLLWGPDGVGKSHLARAICNALLARERVVWARYIYVPEIARRLREDPEAESWLNNASVLVLDDLGALDPRETPGWALGVARCIIDRAERTGRPRIFATSNESGRVIAARMGRPFVGRLHALMDWLEVRGPDARRGGRSWPPVTTDEPCLPHGS